MGNDLTPARTTDSKYEMKSKSPRIAITPGEPAGIGPELVLKMAQKSIDARIVILADPGLLEERCKTLNYEVKINCIDSIESIPRHLPKSLNVLPIQAPEKKFLAGTLDPRNASYVLDTIRTATQGCLTKQVDAMVTGPVHKGVINDAGYLFSGHTEFIAEICAATPVMMLATQGLRVALVTTHIPLAKVAESVTQAKLREVIEALHIDLVEKFGISQPRVLVCGLNPHAGENGHLGKEEIEIITPVLNQYIEKGFNLVGPIPADTAFTPENISSSDAILAMYHDQGLPVLKHLGFGQAINITLGLPIIRTSVDHGTALDLAGTGQAHIGSLMAAVKAAIELSSSK